MGKGTGERKMEGQTEEGEKIDGVEEEKQRRQKMTLVREDKRRRDQSEPK